MKVVTADQMREIERRSTEVGLPSEVLMDNAGLAVAREVKRFLGGAAGRRILFLIGPGNNGGDGLVAARHLHEWGAMVCLYLSSSRDKADRNFALALERGIPSMEVTRDEGFASLENLLPSAEVIVDALLGTGRTRPIEGSLKEVLDRVRKTKEARHDLAIVALDLPSGLNADSGAIDSATLSADITITLGYPKLGLFAFPGAERVGRMVVGDIGIPRSLAQDIPTELITTEWASGLLPWRPLGANKGSFGKVLVCAGCINYIGAAYLACSGAIRVGVGLVTLATARSLQHILAAKLTEVTYIPLPESEPGILHPEASKVLGEGFSGYDVLLMGCGLGQSLEAIEFIRASLLSPERPLPGLVLDADALNTLAKIPGWWAKLPGDAVLTPHPGEMARLTGLSVAEVQADRLGVARRAAAEWGKTVVLKGAYTVIAAPDGQAKLSSFANPGLASAGTGDVLAGAIAGLMAQGLTPFEAAAGGVYLHAVAGEMVREKLGDAGMVASDLLPILPLVIKRAKEIPRS